MKLRWISSVCVLIALLIGPAGTGFCLTGSEIAQLKQAGVSDATIQVVIREKIVETRALTVQEIIDIKQSGMNEDALRIVLEEASFIKGPRTIVYGDKHETLQYTSAQDLVKLKEAGLSDDVLKAIVVSSSEKSSDAERERTYGLLKEMGVVIVP